MDFPDIVIGKNVIKHPFNFDDNLTVEFKFNGKYKKFIGDDFDDYIYKDPDNIKNSYYNEFIDILDHFRIKPTHIYFVKYTNGKINYLISCENDGIDFIKNDNYHHVMFYGIIIEVETFSYEVYYYLNKDSEYDLYDIQRLISDDSDYRDDSNGSDEEANTNNSSSSDEANTNNSSSSDEEANANNSSSSDEEANNSSSSDEANANNSSSDSN